MMLRLHRFLLTCAIALCILPARAEQRAAMPSLARGIGARAIGMGNAYTAVADSADALYWNPSGLALGGSLSLMFNHEPVMDTFLHDVGAVSIGRGRNHLGFGYSQFRSKSIAAFDESGASIGSFRSNEQQFVGGFARAMNHWQWGAAAEYLGHSIDNASGSSLAGGLSAGFENPLSSTLRHALVVQHLGSAITIDGRSSPLPLLARFGTAFRPSRQIVVALDFSSTKGHPAQAALGGEWTIALQRASAIFLRTGYVSGYRDQGGAAGFHLGGGLALSGLRLDYAWVPEGDFGSSQVFTVGYEFASPAPRSAEVRSPSTPDGNAADEKLSVQVQDGQFLQQQNQKIARSPRRSVHEVRRGESLSSIAKQFYGDPSKWQVLYEANRANIADPNNVEAGTRIVIP